MTLLLTRPAADSRRFAARLAHCRIACRHAPLLTIRYRQPPPPLPDGMQAVLLTSANGARALAAMTQRRDLRHDLRVLAVGEATAAAARRAGFAAVEAAEGDVARLAALAARRLDAAAGPLLHVAGSALAGDLAGLLAGRGFRVERRIGYDARPVRRLPAAAREGLQTGRLAGAAFFSPRTAAAFVRLSREAGLEAQTAPLRAFCLSRAVAEAAEAMPWSGIEVAVEARAEALARLICARLGTP